MQVYRCKEKDHNNTLEVVKDDRVKEEEGQPKQLNTTTSVVIMSFKDSDEPIMKKGQLPLQEELSPLTTANDLQRMAAAQQGTFCKVPARLVLVGLSCLGLAISYADRSNIAIAIIPMSKEFGWNPAIEGAIFSCFFYGYMATQILGGYLADRFGGKYVFAAGKRLTQIVL